MERDGARKGKREKYAASEETACHCEVTLLWRACMNAGIASDIPE